MIRFDDEALVGQRQGALLTVEAVLVPAVALVVHHVGALAEPCRGAPDVNNGIHTGGKVPVLVVVPTTSKHCLRVRCGFKVGVRVGLGLVGMVRLREKLGIGLCL